MKPAALMQALGFRAWFIVTAGGLGHMWPASGTWGSLPPVALFVGLSLGDAPAWLQVALQALLCVAACRGCLRHGGKVEAAVGRKDPGVVVIDEVAGMAATLALLPVLACAIDLRFDHLAGPIPRSLAFALAGGGFFAFRAMDVLKPPPARKLQSLPGGLGVLIDDLVVAPYAAVAAMLALVAWAWWLAPVRA